MDTEAISSIAALGALAVMVVIGLPIYLGVRHAGRVREFEHAERMKALEMGQLLPGDQSWWTPMRLCALIGAGVPIGVFSLAMIATNLDSFSHDDTIWTAAGMLGMTSVICGTILATRLLRQGSRTNESVGSNMKTVEDADSYDSVSRRGA